MIHKSQRLSKQPRACAGSPHLVEMKRTVVFMVMILTIGTLLVESEEINKNFQKCFKICFNICIVGPARYKFGCFAKCTKECGQQREIDCVNLRCVSA
ncbi:unnamed protein product [Eruca vesicaria subsp. sativa]|uniref:Thionin-like protein n=1 Tax=Eruca vesicaria subsp. sativa TaxID=29727 RepID=A0ABC8L6N0_ERUVS|nr:unnamed protein product [Eruca vesicaria subsp. sativa]